MIEPLIRNGFCMRQAHVSQGFEGQTALDHWDNAEVRNFKALQGD